MELNSIYEKIKNLIDSHSIEAQIEKDLESLEIIEKSVDEIEKTDQEISAEIMKFKMELLHHMPFYGDIMLNLSFIEDKSISTACTNGSVVYYNPDYFRSQNIGQMNYVILHEVFHIILMHCKRYKGRNPKIWNVATDYVVNGMLDNLYYYMKNYGIPFERPSRGLFPNWNTRSKSAEELYNIIYDGAVKDSKNRVCNLNLANLGIDSCLPSKYKEDLLFPDDGLMKSGQNINVDIAAIIKRAYKQHKNSYSSSGSYFIPNEALKMVDSKKLPWNALLRRYLDKELSDETSYSTPERKYLWMDLIIPGSEYVESSLGEIWAFVDTSGSIGQEAINEFITQLIRISKEFGCKINLAYWDTKVSEVYRNLKSQKEILNANRYSIGGTNINCVYEYITVNKIKPMVMLIFTDGYFGRLDAAYYSQKRRKDTIVVLNSDYVPDDIDKIGRYTFL